MTKVSNCGHDERGRYKDGAAGDQSGTEWYIRDWYYFKQNVVLRHPDAKVRKMIADMAEAAANNNNIGYDQNQRGTFWQQLAKVGYKPEAIKVRCEADCSSGVAAIVKGAGYRLGNKKMQAVSTAVYTGNERAALVAAGFNALTDSKYLTSGDYLLRGDINLNERTHTNICVSSGSKAGSGSSSSSSSSSKAGKLAVDGQLGRNSVSEWQRQLGTYVDGVVSGQALTYAKYYPNLLSVTFDRSGSQMVRALQRKVGSGVDGIIGQQTIKALQNWLTKKGYKVGADGILGKKTATMVQKALNDGKFK